MNTPADDTPLLIENLTYDELQIGQQARMVRALTMDDIKAFALISGDVNPAHLDPVWAESTRFHGVIAHGMWAGALISALLGTEFPGPGTIYMEQSLRFLRPVRVGDVLTVLATVQAKDDSNHNVRLDCEVQNQRGEPVVTGQALVKAPTHKISRPRPVLPAMHLFNPEARLASWVASQRGQPALRCAVVHPCDELSLRSALQAQELGLIEPVLIGPVARLQALAAELGLALDKVELQAASHSHAAAAQAVALAAAGRVSLLARGSLRADELMQAVLAEPALRTGRRMSHVFRMEVPAYPKPLLVTDAALNITPSLEAKADIIRNAIDLAHALGVAQPRVAILAAVETVTPRLASTLDAAALCKMADRGQIQGGVLDGPLGFDNAISADLAHLRHLEASPVAGQADVLVVPDVETGTMLAKQLESLAGAAACGVVVGAKLPIALSSQTDSLASRVAALALAALAAHHAATALKT